jgi:hypothetical protein
LCFSGYDEFWDSSNIDPVGMNTFFFEVGVEISDHPLTVNNSVFPINVTVQIGTNNYTGILSFNF